MVRNFQNWPLTPGLLDSKACPSSNLRPVQRLVPKGVGLGLSLTLLRCRNGTERWASAVDNCIGWVLRKDVEDSKGKFRQSSDPPVHFVGASLVCGLCLWKLLLLVLWLLLLLLAVGSE